MVQCVYNTIVIQIWFLGTTPSRITCTQFGTYRRYLSRQRSLEENDIYLDRKDNICQRQTHI